MTNNRVLLGMSGGTDSSVSAIILLEKGYTVIGVTFEFYSENRDIIRAQELAQKLGIEHHIIDLKLVFKNNVINYFIDGYLSGETPFPCILCNPHIKWKYLLEYANKLNCQFIATGHYVRKKRIGKFEYILMGIDPEKDQSFFLWGLSQKIIKKTIFPLGGFYKEKVREIAWDKGFSDIANKKDSLGICFLSQADYRPFLKEKIEEKGIQITSGNFVSKEGNIIGQHNGYPYYTIGQRRGLDINLNHPVFVLDIRPKKNEVVLGSFDDLYKSVINLKDLNFQNKEEINQNNTYIIKIRYRNQYTQCNILLQKNDTAIIKLKEPISAVAPGQGAALYDGDRLIGGGFILSTK